MGLLDFTDECLAAADGQIKVPGKGKAKRLQVYKNQFIETWFAQAHPITPGVWFGGFIAYGLYVGVTAFPWWAGLLLFAGGVLITTFIEYCLHRWVLHFVPTTKAGRLNHFLLHGYHHDFPNDPMRLVLPPIGIWPIAAVVAAVYWFAFGSYFWPLFAGTAAGYVAYDWVHYYTHYFNPKSGPGKWLKKYHMLHHFDSPHHRFGITSPLWDFVFGTYLPITVQWRKMERERAQASQA